MQYVTKRLPGYLIFFYFFLFLKKKIKEKNRVQQIVLDSTHYTLQKPLLKPIFYINASTKYCRRIIVLFAFEHRLQRLL